MSNFNIMGSYSGIDMSVIDQMIEAEKSKGVQFTNRKDKIEREQGAWKDVGSRLNSLTEKTNALSQRNTFESRTVNSSAGANSSVSVSAGNSAPVGNYALSVNQLATSTRLVGGEITIPEDTKKSPLDRALNLTESFKFRNGDGKSFEVKVKSDDSLRKITQNINSQTKESGIEASVINNRLILKDTKMGARDVAIEINHTTERLGFNSTASRLTGNKVDSEFGPLEGSLTLTNQAGEEFTLDVKDAENLEEIVNKINGYADETGQLIESEIKASGIKASIMDGRLVLTDTSEKNEKNKLSVSGDAAKVLGFYNTTLTGEEVTNVNEIEGSFTIENGDFGTFEIVISKEDDLQAIADKISNATHGEGEDKKSIGITATVSDNGNSLILTNKGLGDIKIPGEPEVVKQLGLSSGSTPATKVQADEVNAVTTTTDGESSIGQGAIFTIDGIKIERDTNRISDAIEGIAFTLESEHAKGASEVISITNNTQKGVDAMKEFVDQYNSVMNFIQTQTDVGSPGEDNNTTGALVGEGSIMRLQSGLRSTLMQRVNGKSIAEFGVEIDRYGVASLDESKLNKALQDDPTSLSRFFYKPDLDPSGVGELADDKKPKETKGMGELFKNFLETYTAKSKGIISTKQSSYERMVKNINEQIETFNDRIDRKRARYIQQFSALDTAMMRAESQMEYLYSQMNIE